MRRLRAALLASCLFGVAPCAPGLASALAQTPPVPKIEFNDAIQRAIANNPTVAQAATAITRADLLVRQARAVNLPAVTGAFTNATLDTGVSFSAGVIQPQNQSTLSGNVTVPVLSLANWAAVNQARDQVDVANLATASTRRDIAIATAEAYLAAIAAQRQVDVEERAVQNARAHRDYAQRRLDAGAGSRLNELRAASELSTTELELETSQQLLRRAQEALGVLVVADGPIDAGAEPALEVPAAISEQDWAQARADVRLEQANQRAAERLVSDSWRDWVGTASASFVPQFVGPAGLFQPGRTWRLTASFVQPIFEGGQRRVARGLREVQVEQSRLALANVMLHARSEVRIGQEAVQSAQRALDSARQAATQSADVLQITTSAFQLGATTNIEVIDAQRTARDADTTAALAEDALRRAKLDLLVAIGQFPR